MKKNFKRVLSLALVFSLVIGIGVFQISTPAAATNIVTNVSAGVTYMFRNVQTGLYMDSNGGISVSNGNSVKTAAYSGNISQFWKLENHEDGYKVIPQSNTDYVLDVQNAWNESGTHVNVRTRTIIDSAQTFFVNNKGDGKFHIKADLGWFVERVVGLEGDRTVLRDEKVSDDRLWHIIIAGTVTYNFSYNGGTSATKTSSSLFEHATVDLSPTASKPDATFLGWNTDPTATTGLSSLKMGNTNLTLYAIFKDKIPVTYDYATNGGYSTSKSTGKFYENEQIDLSPTALKVDARFLGWNTDPAAASGLTSLVMGKTPVTLYAIFEDKIPVTYDFEANGGISSEKTSDKFYEHDPIDLSPLAFKPIATFMGWNTNRDAIDGLPSLIMGAEPVTLYAIFKPQYIATYNYAHNGGTAVSLGNAALHEGDPIDLTITAEKPNATFIGWNTDPDATIGLESLRIAAQDITLYAIFRQDGIVKFVDSSGTREIPVVSFNNNPFPAVSPLLQNAPAEWRTLGWTHLTAANASATPLEGEKLPYCSAYYGLYAVPITVSFSTNGGSTPNAITKDQFRNSFDLSATVDPLFTLPFAAVKQGYTFAGWSDGTTVYPENIDAVFGKNTVLNAIWGEISVDGIGLSSYNVRVNIDDSFTLKATVLPAQATNRAVRWSSSDESIAMVDQNGKITGIHEGNAVVTATTEDGGYTASCNVSVIYVAAPVSHVTLSDSQMQLIIGEGRALTAQVFPADAETKDVAWSSSAPEIASVNQSGYVQSKGIGTAVITVTTLEGGKTATCLVTVNPVKVTGISLTESRISLFVEGTVQLGATVSPSNATDPRYTWSSSDSSVASVDSAGKVTALRVGTATITATTIDGNKTASCVITVNAIRVTGISLTESELKLYLGGNAQLGATVTPENAQDKRYTWSSSDAAIASVDSDGVVRALKVGTALITATTADGSLTASCKITVQPILVSKVTLTPGNVEINVGAWYTFSASVQPSNATNQALAWSSSDSSVAEILSNGTVRGVAPGTAVISATANDSGKVVGQATVKVNPILVSGITVSPAASEIMVGNSASFIATVMPSNATNSAVVWSSSNTSIATVDASGKVTGVAPGSVIITAMAADGGGVVRQATVTVKPALVQSISISPNDTEINVGGSRTLYALVSPSNATNKELTWESSNSKIASVNSSGQVTGVAVGEVVITAKAKDGSGVTAISTVTVKQQTAQENSGKTVLETSIPAGTVSADASENNPYVAEESTQSMFDSVGAFFRGLFGVILPEPTKIEISFVGNTPHTDVHTLYYNNTNSNSISVKATFSELFRKNTTITWKVIEDNNNNIPSFEQDGSPEQIKVTAKSGKTHRMSLQAVLPNGAVSNVLKFVMAQDETDYSLDIKSGSMLYKGPSSVNYDHVYTLSSKKAVTVEGHYPVSSNSGVDADGGWLYVSVDGYKGYTRMGNKATTITLNDSTMQLSEGQELTYRNSAVAVRGTITSDSNITEVWAQILEGSTVKYGAQKATPNAKSFNLNTGIVGSTGKSFNDILLFSQLPVGNYKYVVKAKDANSSLITLRETNFKVVAANGNTVTDPPNSDINRGTVAQYLAMGIGYPFSDKTNVHTISSHFGPRDLSISSGYHLGTDIVHTNGGASTVGKQLISVCSGTVVDTTKSYNSSTKSPGQGYSISIKSNITDPDTGNKLIFTYMHMREATTLRNGDPVSVTTTLGYAGGTGNITGPHLHFECSNHTGPWSPGTTKATRVYYRVNSVFFYPSGTFNGDTAIWNEQID